MIHCSKVYNWFRIKKEAGILDAFGEQTLRDAEQRHLDDKGRLAKAKRFNRHFGTVYCTSGAGRTVDGYLMDWGLVELDAKRFESFDGLTNVRA